MDVSAPIGSPLNFVPSVQGEARDLGRVYISDVTLRDGEQAPDAAFTVEEKVRVAAALEEFGVHQIQAGHARQDKRTALLLKQAGINTPLELLAIGFLPTWKADIDAAAEAGADAVNVVIRCADHQIAYLGHSRQQTVERAIACMEYARSQGIKTAVLGPSFTTQADLAFVKEVVRAGVEAGAQRIDVADTLGVARPAAIKFLVREIVEVAGVPIGVHCHNDYGLGVACTLAGLEGGATWADVSVNGVGERAGNTSLEEVVMALRNLYGLDLGLKTERLCELSRTVSDALRIPVPGNKAVVGDNTFAQKLDAHVMVAAKRPEFLEPYSPALVGNRRHIRLGKGSGVHAVRAKLADLGLSADDSRVEELVVWVNQTAERIKGPVPDASVAEFLLTQGK